MQLFEQIKNMVHFKTTRNRCTGIGAQLRVKAIYIKADVYFLRQFFNNILAYLLPACTFELLFLNILIEESGYAVGVFTYHDEFLVTIITDTYLHQFFHL